MKKVLSVLLAITMLFTTMAAVSTEAFAAVPKTSITKLAPYKRQIKVFVKKNSKVSGYQIKYSTNKKFKSAKTKTLKGSSKTMARLMKLGHKKTYYFKVRTYKKSGKKTKYSKWSKVKKTTTNNKMDERYNKLIKEIYNAAKSGKATDEASAKKNLSKNAFDFFCAWNSYDVGAYTRYNELTYGFTDLDSNGIDELILGDDYGVYGIFTVSAGKLCFVYGQYGRMIITVYGKTVYTYFHGGIMCGSISLTNCLKTKQNSQNTANIIMMTESIQMITARLFPPPQLTTIWQISKKAHNRSTNL